MIYVSGSLAIDRIMDFHGYYKDHIFPENVHELNVSFLVEGVYESFGGTAGNIAYNLALLGQPVTILSQVGKDFGAYRSWLATKGVDLSGVVEFASELTAAAYIMTDRGDNQIAAFHPGAMKYRSAFPEERALDREQTLAILSPGNIQDMLEYKKFFQASGVRVIADPGQQIPAFSKEELEGFLDSSYISIMNDYEYAAVQKKLDRTERELLSLCGAFVVTKGEQGSVIIRREKTISIPAFSPLIVVDPTGAGDAYRAGLIRGLTNGWDSERSARLGAVVASFAIEKQGTQAHSFSQRDIEKRYEALTQGAPGNTDSFSNS